jgi:hypothetical protein
MMQSPEVRKLMQSEAVIPYSEGLFYLSVCAPESMPRGEVERQINRTHPSGTENGWRIAADPKFATGEPHPGPCSKDRKRTHWLLEA